MNFLRMCRKLPFIAIGLIEMRNGSEWLRVDLRGTEWLRVDLRGTEWLRVDLSAPSVPLSAPQWL